LLVFLVRIFGGARELTSALRSAQPGWVFASLLLACSTLLAAAVRWQQALGAMGYALGFGRSLEVILATWPPILVTPGRANEFLRAAAIRRQVPLSVGAASVLVEKIVDLLTLLVAACAGALLASMWMTAWGLLACMAAVLLALWVLRRSPEYLLQKRRLARYASHLEALKAAFFCMQRSRWKLFGLFMNSLLIRILGVLVIAALIAAFGGTVHFAHMLALWPLAVLVGLIPITVGGIGTRDAAFLYLLGLHHQKLSQAGLLAATMSYSLITVCFFAAIGLPFMLRELRGVFVEPT
jgi:hypothetical protein